MVSIKTKNEFGNVLFSLRKRRFASRSAFARRSGYTECCIKAWERGQRRPTQPHFEEILLTFQGADASRQDLDELIRARLDLGDLQLFIVVPQDPADAAGDVPMARPFLQDQRSVGH